GPVRLFAADMDAMLAFYRDDLGFAVTEEVKYKKHRCFFLRTTTEHHSVALYPLALRDELARKAHSTLLSFGLQLGSDKQMRGAVAFPQADGVTITPLPPELFPGIDYTVLALHPDGFAVQPSWYMEQVGWDGRPRPTSQRPKIDNASWPEAVDGKSDA